MSDSACDADPGGGVVDLAVIVDGSDHLLFRKPRLVADLLAEAAVVRSVVVLDRLTGLTSSSRNDEVLAGREGL